MQFFRQKQQPVQQDGYGQGQHDAQPQQFYQQPQQLNGDGFVDDMQDFADGDNLDGGYAPNRGAWLQPEPQPAYQEPYIQPEFSGQGYVQDFGQPQPEFSDEPQPAFTAPEIPLAVPPIVPEDSSQEEEAGDYGRPYDEEDISDDDFFGSDDPFGQEDGQAEPEAEPVAEAPVQAPSAQPGGEPDSIPFDEFDELRDSHRELLKKYENLKEEFEEISEAEQTMSDRYDKLKNDWNNYRRRTEETLELEKANASKELVREILPALDDFELAITHAQQAGASEDLVSGMYGIYKKLVTSLARKGVEQVRGKGAAFDINTQQAVERREDTDLDPDMVAEVFQTGYVMNGTVLRPALVAVTA